MKYKTLFRLALKAIGVLLFAQGATMVITLFGNIGNLINMLGQPNIMRALGWNLVFYMVAYLFQAGFGLYLFFGGGRIVNLAIPSNRPYCHECGYDLTGNESGACPECGSPTAERPADSMSLKRPPT